MLDLLSIVLAQYAWLGIWLSCALLNGLALQALLHGKRDSDFFKMGPELAVFFGMTAGLAVQIVVLILVASSHQLNFKAILLANALLSGGSAWTLWKHADFVQSWVTNFEVPWQQWLVVLPILLIIGAWLIRPLVPAAGSDSLTYHLPYARFYLEQGGLAVNDTLRFPLHTHSINLLYSVALLRPGPQLAQLLHASMGWLSLLGVYGAARLWHGWPTAIMAAAAVLLLDEFIFSFSAAFVDNGVMLFITAAFLALAFWQQGRTGNEPDQSWLWLAAVFADSVMSSKYLGAWFTVPLGLWVLWQSRSLTLSLRFAVLVSLLGLFWYVRSWWLTGNPVHPFAGEWFGYTIWTAYDLQGQMRELGGHGLEKTWQNFLLLPLKMFTDWHRFNGGSGQIGWLIGLFMASSVFLPLQRPLLRPIHLTCLVYLLFWFMTSQVIRYLMVILPLLSLCTMVLLVECFNRLLAPINLRLLKGKSQRLIGYSEAITLGLVLILTTYLSAQRFYRDILWFPLTAEKQDQALLKNQVAYAPAMAALADPRIARGPILQFQMPEIRWFFPGSVYGDWMGLYPYRNFGHLGDSGYWEINSGAVLSEQVRAIGAVAVAVRKGQRKGADIPQKVRTSNSAHRPWKITWKILKSFWKQIKRC